MQSQKPGSGSPGVVRASRPPPGGGQEPRVSRHVCFLPSPALRAPSPRALRGERDHLVRLGLAVRKSKAGHGHGHGRAVIQLPRRVRTGGPP